MYEYEVIFLNDFKLCMKERIDSVVLNISEIEMMGYYVAPQNCTPKFEPYLSKNFLI